MNRRACPACAERYPLQHGLHHLPDGNAIRCALAPPRRLTAEQLRRARGRARHIGLALVWEDEAP